MKTKALSFLTVAVLLACSACSPNPADASKTTEAEIDTIAIWADSSARVIVQEEIKAFENIYKFPRFNPTFLNEDAIIKGLLDNTISLAVLHRMLTEQEIKVLTSRENFKPKQYVFAYDAYAFITSDLSFYETLEANDLERFLKGQSDNTYTLGIENSNAQAKTFLKNHFNLNAAQLSKLFAAKSVEELMAYLRTNPKAIAMIPFSYISDVESDSTATFLKDLKVLPVTAPDSTGKITTTLPTQSSISTKEYPMISPIVLVNCNMEKKSGTNFVNFLFKSKAQRLILKCGLSPAVFPGREVIIKP